MKTLRTVLLIISILMGLGGLAIIFGMKKILLLFSVPDFEISTLFLLFMKDFGGVLLMVSVLIFFAYRDPVKNAAILDGLIIGLVILAITPVIGLYTVNVRSLPAFNHPGWFWTRSLTRLALAYFLFMLKASAPSA